MKPQIFYVSGLISKRIGPRYELWGLLWSSEFSDSANHVDIHGFEGFHGVALWSSCVKSGKRELGREVQTLPTFTPQWKSLLKKALKHTEVLMMTFHCVFKCVIINLTSWILAIIMSWFVAGWSLLHFQIKHNYHPKAQALMNPRLPFQNLDHTLDCPEAVGIFAATLYFEAGIWRRILPLLSRSFCFFFKGSAQCDWTSSHHKEETCQKFLTVPFCSHRDDKKKARQELMVLVSSFPAQLIQLLALTPKNSREEVSILTAHSCNSPAVPLCLCSFRSGKVFGETVQTLRLISSARPKWLSLSVF